MFPPVNERMQGLTIDIQPSADRTAASGGNRTLGKWRDGRKGWLAGAALLAVLAGWWASQGSGGPARAKAEAGPIPVTTAQAAEKDVPVVLEGVGTVQALQSVNVQAQTDGVLVKVAFSEGQQIHVGDVLAQIDPRSNQAALDAAVARRGQDEAQLVNARNDVQRNAPLAEKNFLAPQAYDAMVAKVAQLEAAVKSDEAAINAARVQLDFTTIRSPIDGRAGLRLIDVGNVVHGGGEFPSGGGAPALSSSGGSPTSDTLVVIRQLQPIAVLFALPQDELPRILAANAKGHAAVAAYGRGGGDPIEQGELSVVDNSVDAATGTVRLKAIFVNRTGQLWPGQFVNARLLVDTRRKTVTVPATAVQRTAAEGDNVTRDVIVVVKDDGSLDYRTVAVGAVSDDTAEILKGVAAGETVVVAGHYRLRPGAKVATHPADRG